MRMRDLRASITKMLDEASNAKLAAIRTCRPDDLAKLQGFLDGLDHARVVIDEAYQEIHRDHDDD